MRTIRGLVAAGFLMASSAHAALISVTADTGWFAVPFEGIVIPEYGTMNLVYDSSVTDSNPDPTVGVYNGAIVSFTMTVEQQNRPDLFFTLAPGPNALTVGYPLGNKFFTLTLTAEDQSGAYGQVPVVLNGYRVFSTGLDDLMPDAAYWESGIVAFVGSVGPASETDWGWNFRAVTLVPTVGTFSLMIGGLVPIAATRFLRRRSDRHRRLRNSD